MWYHRLPDKTLTRMICTPKGDCMYVLCGRKEKGARGNIFVSAKYSYAYVHMASLSKNRSVAPQNHQNISEAKYFSNSRKQCVYALVEIFLHSEFFTHAWTKSFGMNKRLSARSEKEKKPRVRTKKLPFAPGLSVCAYHTNGR